MNKKALSITLAGSSLLLGICSSLVVATADFLPGTASGLSERYSNTSIPDRSDLMGSLPSLPAQFPLDPAVARQQGARSLQGMNPREAVNPDKISEQLNTINAESANPGQLTQNLPAGAASLGRGVVNTQATSMQSSSNGTVGNNSPSDPLGSDPAAAAARQSTVTRSGTLPNGALNVSAGDPLALASTLSAQASTDVENAYINYLSSVLASKLQVLNNQTALLAGKIATVNEDMASINRKMNNIVEKMNSNLTLLPTIPQR